MRSTLEPEGGFRHARIDDDDVVAQVREAMMIYPHEFTSRTLPTLHHQGLADPTRERKKPVIILKESRGAESVGAR